MTDDPQFELDVRQVNNFHYVKTIVPFSSAALLLCGAVSQLTSFFSRARFNKLRFDDYVGNNRVYCYPVNNIPYNDTIYHDNEI